MKIGAVICEYNPFHKGHLYQLEKIKKEFSPYVICLMSSNFTQRGTPSIISKFDRAKIAVEMGASLVLELPVIFSSASASNFAFGGVSILNSLKIVDRLFFGCEDDYPKLDLISEKILNMEERISLKKYLKEGYSFIEAKNLSMNFLTNDEKNMLSRANNILAIEYINSIKKLSSNMTYEGILRRGNPHLSLDSKGDFLSSTALRKLIYENMDTSEFLPYKFKDFKIHRPNDYFEIFKAKILLEKIDFSKFMDYEEGLEKRFLKNLDTKNIYEFVNIVNSKRYTSSRISRLINEILLDIKKEDVKNSFSYPYFRVLAMDNLGKEILKEIKGDKIIKFKDSYKKSSGFLKNILDMEVRSSNLYNLKFNILNEDFIKSPYVKW